jgi:DNA invertase Pin-like site-specific DNA recombinase
VKTAHTSPAPLAFSYVRFSTPEQAKGDSLRRQATAAADWCERNGARLDQSTTLHDLGKSAYTGSHRQNPDRNALAAFLKLVEGGRVPRGSILLIENLDRLSREHEVPACHLLTGILMAGVNVVQLSPYEMLLTEKSNGWELMRAVMELSRGHGESAIKSERLAKAWDHKRAGIGEKKLTGKAPFWLTLADDGKRFLEKSEAVAVVRRIFRLARDGYGSAAIAKRLNADDVPSPYRAKQRNTDGRIRTRANGSPYLIARPWNNVSVLWVLRSRAVVGEYTPHRGNPGARKPAGPPIADYYPRVISDDEFWAVQHAIQMRKTQRGRRGRYVRNLFTGLARDARDGEPLHLNEKRPGDVRMVSSGATRRTSEGRGVTFPYPVFERAVLSMLREIDPGEVLGRRDGPDEAMALAGELARVDARIDELEAELDNGDVAALAKALRRLEGRKRELSERLAQARSQAASPLSATWGEYQTLADIIGRAPDQEDTRSRLRAVLRRMVDTVMCLFVAKGHWRLAAVQVWFTGDGHRDYLIAHTARPVEQVHVRSFAATGVTGLDLRKPAHAKRLEKFLSDVDPGELE